ncbi:hypothetical protein F4820DRAFT_455575 [Hypoxylon rubiginosum]|uniref:Uncharacterized protein n=1 Tax=Hypoxylon rubiginosum TaxID=110542 RepID=A0ACB9ZDU5_9PEZI|nr:hypothetical protein F4820DRAFT_455575 [Hypoxylon rubiginosum]
MTKLDIGQNDERLPIITYSFAGYPCFDKQYPVSDKELQFLNASRHLRSTLGNKCLSDDLINVLPIIESDHFRVSCVEPVLKAVVQEKPDDEIWAKVRHAVAELAILPWQATSSLERASEPANFPSGDQQHVQRVEDILTNQICPMYIGLNRFHELHFGDIAGLQIASEAVFARCREGDNPIFAGGWVGFPAQANAKKMSLDSNVKMDVKKDVLTWYRNLVQHLSLLSQEYNPTGTAARTLIVNPLAATGKQRKLDFGIAASEDAGGVSQILVPGKLKQNSHDDVRKTWYSIGRYAREVLYSQHTRRFVLAFTLAGPLMRIWQFDRLGCIASDEFNVNQDGLRFVASILGFFQMDEKQLGFDPTIMRAADGNQYIDFERNGTRERLIIDRSMKRPFDIAGRGTTCWQAHSEADPHHPLVIKDSWQKAECDEGKLLQEATDKGVVNVARLYHHYTVKVSGAADDVQQNVRKNLDVTMAEDFRSSTQHPAKETNRVHRRIILSDQGLPIFCASSRVALLDALDACMDGHRSLLIKTGLLHRDISVNNIVINEKATDPSLRAFLIDLDLAARWELEGRRDKVGTRPFMAIGLLRGEPNRVNHDLESFFWVLFWLCVHYDGPGNCVGQTRYTRWKSARDLDLATRKLGTIADDAFFETLARRYFTPYFRPLVPWVCLLKAAVFPNSRPRETEADLGLYARMQSILRAAQNDPFVRASY